MPKMASGVPVARDKAPAIGELRHRVIICTTVEKPDGDVSTIVGRPGVIEVHARITPLRGDEVLDYKAVAGVFRTSIRVNPTYEFVIRTPPDVKIDMNHWIYWDDGIAASWYRVRLIEDIGMVRRFMALQCTLDTTNDRRSDPATQRSPEQWETPDMGDPPPPPVMDIV